MIRSAVKILRTLFYAAIILAGVIFAVSNRGMVELTFYPVPYVVTMPLFLFIILIFAGGICTGWIIARFAAQRYKRAGKVATKRVTALENELGSLRSEMMSKPAMALPRQ